MDDTATQQVFATVSERILREVPRFFQSFEAAIAELCQNAYRSGATELHVTYDRESTQLVLADNGPGLADPHVLLAAGATGWDEAEIVEPAGLGAFALLRPEFVKRVEYTSRGAGNWRMELTPDVLTGAPGILEPLPPGDGETGLTVCLRLGSDIRDVTPETLARARAFYPLHVTFQGEDVLPVRSWSPSLTLNTPVGPIEWTAHTGPDGTECVAIWEHRPILSRAFQRALNRAANESSETSLACALVTSCRIRWFVNPDSSVRPQLPDRTELLDDAFLANAAQVIVDTLVPYVLSAAREASAEWPDRITPYDLGRLTPAAPWLGVRDIQRVLLPVLGWHHVAGPDLGSIWVTHNQWDGTWLEYDSIDHYDRTAVLVSSPSLALTLNALGHPAALVEAATDPQVTVTLLKSPDGDQCPVALASSIEVAGVGLVPFLLADVHDCTNSYAGIPGLESTSADVILAGDAASCVRYLWSGGDPEVLGAVLLRQEEEGFFDIWLDWTDWTDQERPEIDYTAVVRDLILAITDVFDPDLSEARDQYYATLALKQQLAAVKRPLADARAAIEKLNGRLSADVQFETEAAIIALQKASDGVDSLMPALEAAAGFKSVPDEEGGV